MAEFGKRLAEIARNRDTVALKNVILDMEDYRNKGGPKTDLDIRLLNASIDQAHSTLRQVERRTATPPATPPAPQNLRTLMEGGKAPKRTRRRRTPPER
jgi:hypothetical protein